MAHYLVTGGCGFIGSHLVDALERRGHRVRVLDDLSSGKRNNISAATEFVEADVCDVAAVTEALSDVDGCFHLAAIASVERSTRAWIETHRTNLTGTITVLEGARRQPRAIPPRVVYASSAAVYGDNASTFLSEVDEPRPLTPYGADKLGCELHARVASLTHGVPTVGFRLFNVYGPRQDPRSPYSGVISVFAQRMREGLPLIVHGDGQQTRDFVYVADVVEFLIDGMTVEGPMPEVLNVCTGKPTSIVSLAGTLFALHGRPADIRRAPPRRGDVRISIGDPNRALRRLMRRAETDLPEGLRRTLDDAGGAGGE